MVHREFIQKMVNFSAKTKPVEAVLRQIKILSANNGNLEAEMTVGEEHTNIFGTLHGGCTATIVDCLSSYAVLTHPKLVDKLETSPNSGVSVDMHLTYLRAAAKGEEILIKADTIKAGRTLAFLEVRLLNKKTGDILAKGSHTKFIA